MVATHSLGQDSRYNNTTVDGAYFNNSFGLMGQVGERTGVAPISLDAIEQVRVNIAPYDVRQGNFVGAAVNSVTKSGTNSLSGTVAFGTRNNTLRWYECRHEHIQSRHVQLQQDHRQPRRTDHQGQALLLCQL